MVLWSNCPWRKALGESWGLPEAGLTQRALTQDAYVTTNRSSKMKKPKVTRRVNAVGFYGWENFGDELFRESISLNRELLWGPRVKVRSFVFPIKRLHQSSSRLGSLVRFTEMIVGGVWADRISFCGGSVLEDLTGNSKARFHLFGKTRKIEALGVSLGPWASEEAETRVQEFVGTLERVVVRDQASHKRSRNDVVLGADLAALHPMHSVPDTQRTHITICPSKDSGCSALELVDFLTPLLVDQIEPVRILALNARALKGDIEFSEEIARLLVARGIVTSVEVFDSVDSAIRLIASSRAVWSQRLHGFIVAYLCDVPALALAHHQKIIDFAEDIGLAQTHITPSLLPSEQMLLAAQETMEGIRPWSLHPHQYVTQAFRSFGRGRSIEAPN